MVGRLISGLIREKIEHLCSYKSYRKYTEAILVNFGLFRFLVSILRLRD